MRSMTGFGKGEGVAGGVTVSVEIASVNRKQLDIRINADCAFSSLEPEFRKRIGAVLSRGAVNLRVAVRNSGGAAPLNRELLAALGREILTLRADFGLPRAVDFETLLTVPGVLGSATVDTGETPERDTAVLAALDVALDAFQEMRTREGVMLLRDLSDRRDRLKTLLGTIRPMTAAQGAAQKQRLLDKLAADNLPVSPEDERFQRELLYYLDKSDVSEELARLDSHFVQLERFFTESAQPVGRSLDFLIQEMFREITTLGNKVSGPDFTPLVVEFKTELEKLREQVQNVE